MKFNSILLVLPILTILMFDLGLSLRVSDFVNIFKKPKAMLAGLFGQLVLLPLIALAVGTVCRLQPEFFIALMLLAGIFFIQNKTVIISQFGTLGLATGGLILGSIAAAAVICLIFRLRTTERRTIVIEVGMQNAAQAIAVATSPFVFGNPVIATPAIIYALLMNVVLLSYMAVIGLAHLFAL